MIEERREEIGMRGSVPPPSKKLLDVQAIRVNREHRDEDLDLIASSLGRKNVRVIVLVAVDELSVVRRRTSRRTASRPNFERKQDGYREQQQSGPTEYARRVRQTKKRC